LTERLLDWLKRLLMAATLAVVLAGCAVGAVVGPYVLDDLALDRVVRAVALDWRDFGEERAAERLQYELDHQAIGTQVGDQDCRLESDEDDRFVRCRWVAELSVPGAGLVIPLTFRSTAQITKGGDIR